MVIWYLAWRISLWHIKYSESKSKSNKNVTSFCSWHYEKIIARTDHSYNSVGPMKKNTTILFGGCILSSQLHKAIYKNKRHGTMKDSYGTFE